MDENVIFITAKDIESIDMSEYSSEITEQFAEVPEVAKPLIKRAKATFKPANKKSRLN